MTETAQSPRILAANGGMTSTVEGRGVLPAAPSNTAATALSHTRRRKAAVQSPCAARRRIAQWLEKAPPTLLTSAILGEST